MDSKAIHTFATGGLNLDDDKSVVPATDWTDALDFDPGLIGSGKSGAAVLPATIISGLAGEIIGDAEDRENSRVYIFIAASSAANHRIIELDRATGVTVTIMQGANFAFSSDNLINGAIVLGDNLIFNDASNRVRHIHIPSAKAGKYTNPVVSSEISLDKRPPNYPLTAIRGIDPDISFNFISQSAFVFSYRYVYLGGLASVLAPWSKPTWNAPDYAVDGHNKIDIVLDNREEIPLPVEYIQLFVKRPEDNAFFQFKELTRTEIVGSSGLIGSGVDAPSVPVGDSDLTPGAIEPGDAETLPEEEL